MKKTAFYLLLLLSISFVTSCTPPVQHDDPFYDPYGEDYPRNHLPLIKPIEATRERSSYPWIISLPYCPWVSIPNSQEEYGYCHIEELDKFAVENGVIMAYSSYVDKRADAYIQENYYHWFVIIPDQELAIGFHTEDEFLQHIQTLGVSNPDWQTPDEAFDEFVQTGCLEWIPDCK